MNADVVVPYLLVLLAAGLFALVVWAIAHDSKQWEEFRRAHACEIVGHMDSDVFNTLSVDSKGMPVVGIGTTPSKTGWKCNDGVTYWNSYND